MESTVDTQETTSQYLFEDEYCYVTETGDIFRRENDHMEAQKVAETEQEKLEETLAELRANFEDLQKQVDEPGTLSEEEAEAWKTKLHESKAIGDFSLLFDTIAQHTDVKEEEPQEEVEDTSGTETDNAADDTAQNPVAFYKKLTNQAQELAKQDDWNKVERKLKKLSHEWSDGPEVEDEEAKDKIRDLYYKFTKAEEGFQKRKEDFFAQSEKKRKDNLDAKRKVLKEIEDVVNAEEWSATGKIKNLEDKWHSIGNVPKEQADDVEDKFKSLVKEFKSHKVDRLVERRQKLEDNLMMKMVVLDKMERVAGGIDDNTTQWKEVEHTFSDLTKQWKKIGRVPREKANQVWERYKAAQDLYYDNKYRFHKEHRSHVDSFTAKKENIIEEAEALVDEEDIAKAARQVNKLHHRWKKIGNLPQRREDELWDQFKAATDAFNERKSNNIDKLHEQEEEHYRQKLELIEKAEEIKETTDWDKGHQQMQSLMDRWKKIGPVPRKKSNTIWKQFKGAMDVFYDRRREHFKEAKEQQKENLKKKEEILDELYALGQHEDPIGAVEEAKKLQAQFKDVGYVPIKKKNEMWRKYREACDVIYDRMRAAQSGDRFDQELAKADLDPEQRSQIQDLRKEFKKIKKEVRSLKEEVIQLEESKTNFNFSDDDNPLLKDMNDKIHKAQAKLESRQNKLDALSIEMEDIREEG